ncbi:hypothetical protein [Paraburkholderia acidisoli]|uniref:Phage protein n=1 Tax=Paraburkholderia acidisoli TaxID=2571748 RepID=A0A7Z2GR76_9BURK|nr:hypothetical protein [Paraburkholderia acidisoli]QGZ66296.1 hypothetical protein FAZ98_31370 [Paraburkholderia acidisoli]QGZ66382.1 hypothetical protein FAZ98_31855 [Paraburkholderia acidisoli]
MTLQKILDEGTVDINEPNEFFGEWDSHQIWVKRVDDERWYITVRDPSGCYTYDGYWDAEKYVPIEEAIKESIKGAMLEMK